MVKKLLIPVIAAMFMNFYSPPSVSAEQAAAETYRQLINSGQFYLEYTPDGDYAKRKTNFKTMGLAVSGMKKMTYSSGFGITSAAAYIPIIGGFIGTGFKLNGNYYYDGENYYSINSKKEVIKATPAQLQDKYINPIDAICRNSIDKNYSVILNTFGMFSGDSQISFVDSGERTVDKKGKLTLKYDKYVKNVRNSENKNQWQTFFYVYYDEKNELVGIDQITVEQGVDVDSQMIPENNEVIHTIVNKFTATLPEDAFKLPEKAKVYEPWLGDMNELVDQRVPAES